VEGYNPKACSTGLQKQAVLRGTRQNARPSCEGRLCVWIEDGVKTLSARRSLPHAQPHQSYAEMCTVE
tara:strand:+ start:417 stop:620 length:204 start_codon:yes stop_codon:yes gene_type:complete